MVALPPVHVREYDDSGDFPKTPSQLAAEKAYREAFYNAVCEAARLPYDEFADALGAAWIERRKTRERNQVVVPSWVYLNCPDKKWLDGDQFMYIAGYEPEAARARGRVQAFEMIRQFDMELSPDVPFEVVQAFVLKPWAERLKSWVTKDVDTLVCPTDPWEMCPKEQMAILDCFKPIKAEVQKREPLCCLPHFRSARDLLLEFSQLKRPVIEGLLRRGETMNIISASKIGKSWLATDLALAVATGRDWLDTFRTVQGEVLILDNELHPETTAARIPKVAEARGIPLDAYGDRVFVENMRGDLRTIPQLFPYFYHIEAGRFDLIVLDALYRLLPAETSENDNAAMAGIYNHLDQIAARLACAIVCVHHSSKGLQSGKAITDVGAGAGSQARATDTHLILRPHQEPDAAVLEAAVRSWPPIEPICLRWNFPVWTPDDSLDPADLKSEWSRRRRKKEKPESKPPEPEWTVERFVEQFVGLAPQEGKSIIALASEQGVSKRKAKDLLKEAEQGGMIHRWKFGSTKPVGFATKPQAEGGL
jgi:hypothetical protein